MARILIENGADLNLMGQDGNSALIIAASKGRNIKADESKNEIDLLVFVIKSMIQKGADLNRQNKDGQTALMVSCLSRSELFNAIIKFMLENNANVDLQNEAGKTALMLALESESFDKAHLLIEHGANLNIANKRGNTALMVAIDNDSDLSIINTMIEKGANVNIQNANTGNTLLHYTCLYKGREKYAELLIDKGADLNIQNNKGKTPLMLSFEKRSFIITEMLIEKGADLNILDNNGEGAFFYMCNFTLRDLEFQLRSSFNNYKKLGDLRIYGKHLERVQQKYFKSYHILNNHMNLWNLYMEYVIDCHEGFIKKEVLIKQENKKGQTPLLKLIESNSETPLIKWFIENGADLQQRDKEGKTALFYALENKIFDIVNILIDNGANLHFKCEEKNSSTK